MIKRASLPVISSTLELQLRAVNNARVMTLLSKQCEAFFAEKILDKLRNKRLSVVNVIGEYIFESNISKTSGPKSNFFVYLTGVL